MIASTSASQWACTACTFLNEPHSSRCDICLTNKTFQKTKNQQTNNIKQNDKQQKPHLVDLTLKNYDDDSNQRINLLNTCNTASTASYNQNNKLSMTKNCRRKHQSQIDRYASIESIRSQKRRKRTSCHNHNNNSNNSKNGIGGHHLSNHDQNGIVEQRMNATNNVVELNRSQEQNANRSSRKKSEKETRNQTGRDRFWKSDIEIKSNKSLENSNRDNDSSNQSILSIPSSPSWKMQSTLHDETIVHKLNDTHDFSTCSHNSNTTTKGNHEHYQFKTYRNNEIENENTKKDKKKKMKNEITVYKLPSSQQKSYDELWKDAQSNMNNIFKIQCLRNLQPKAVQSALKRKNQIIIMATGGGKSLCYQLPASVLPGITIVISPLIALMVDQVRSLNQIGIEAVSYSSADGHKANAALLQRLDTCINTYTKTTTTNLKANRNSKKNDKKDTTTTSPKPPIKLLYCTPELIQTNRFRAVLINLYKGGKLDLIALDEAHCISTWGHDFRPAYRKLSWLRSSFPDLPFMACTATATKHVISDIKQILNIDDCLLSSFNRPNISYEVRYKDTMSERDCVKNLINIVKHEHSKASKKNEPCSGIIYVHKREDTTSLVAKISEHGIKAAPYHAGLSDKLRKEIQYKWTSGDLKVVVATVAFGMGIDIPCVRYVLHWSMSKSIEAFYQESGRCGRDMKPARSILYFSREEANTFSYLIRKQEEKNHDASGMGNALSKSTNRGIDALTKMVDYCTKLGCRRKFLLDHFGESIDPESECKSMCDYCKNPESVEKAMNYHDSNIFQATKDTMHQKSRFDKQQWQKKHSSQFEENSYDDDKDGYNKDLDCTTSNGLGIYKGNDTAILEEPSIKKKISFSSAKDILSRYEKMELKEGKKTGFVKFKSKSITASSTSKDNIIIPKHLQSQTLDKPLDSLVQKNPKCSKDLHSDVMKLKAEIAKLNESKKQILMKHQISKNSIPEHEMPLAAPKMTFRKKKS